MRHASLLQNSHDLQTGPLAKSGQGRLPRFGCADITRAVIYGVVVSCIPRYRQSCTNRLREARASLWVRVATNVGGGDYSLLLNGAAWMAQIETPALGGGLQPKRVKGPFCACRADSTTTNKQDLVGGSGRRSLYIVHNKLWPPRS